jgi:GntR family transcriptional regulator
MSVSRRKPIRIQLDPRAGQPIYLQIVQHILQQRSLGRVQPGVQLPTVRELARRLGVNFNTVARAYRQLARTGIVSTQPGRGTFVLPAAATRRTGGAALQELASEYIARARRLQFGDSQIASAVTRGLTDPRVPKPPGDNLE